VSQLEREDMQGLIARGYPDLPAATYVLLRVVDPSAARSWLADIARQVTPAPARPDAVALNVAFTASGLQAIGLPGDVLGQFSHEFRTGMTTPHRRRILGDTGDSAPERWAWGGPTTPSPDVLLLLFARDEATLEQHEASVSNSARGVEEIQRLETHVDLDGREHFGFADGISQPTVDGLSSRTDIPSNTIRPGEFILGYENEYGRYTERPLVETTDALSPDVEGSGRADLGRNGTYLVFRHLAQDVHAFWEYVDRVAAAHGVDSTWLAAKMVGRWPDGAPMTLAPDRDDPGLTSANDFTYQYADAAGLSCPLGAHVRRAHPRDSLDPDPGTLRSVRLDKRHRLLRRGREYGPPVADPRAARAQDDVERGLYFIALAGNVARQFEFVQHTWLNNPSFDGLYDEPDPLVARHEASHAFSIPAEPVRTRLTSLPTFVTVRGGAYFFLPGIRALRYLATLAAV
jgi:Dyp-type peroxidase family